jgi:hypothetical protein
LMHYSQFAMACIGEGVAPSKLRLHLLKVCHRSKNSLSHFSIFEDFNVVWNSRLTNSVLGWRHVQELSGMPSTLRKEMPQQGSPSPASNATTADRADRASSSSGTTAAAAAAADNQVDRAAYIPYQDRGV